MKPIRVVSTEQNPARNETRRNTISISISEEEEEEERGGGGEEEEDKELTSEQAEIECAHTQTGIQQTTKTEQYQNKQPSMLSKWTERERERERGGGGNAITIHPNRAAYTIQLLLYKHT